MQKRDSSGDTMQDELLYVCVWCSVTASNPLSHPGTQSVPPSQPLCGRVYGRKPTDKTGCLSPILIPNHSRDKASCPWHVHPSVAAERTSNIKVPPARWDTRALTGTYCTSRQAEAHGGEAYISTLSRDNSSHIKSCWLIKRSAWQNDLCSMISGSRNIEKHLKLTETPKTWKL